METRHLIDGVLNGTRPISRQEMAGYLAQMIESTPAELVLNPVEAEQLEFLKIEFFEELAVLLPEFKAEQQTRLARFKKLPLIDPLLPDFLYRNNRNFLSYQHEAFQCFIDPILYRDALFAEADTLTATERVYQDMNGFTFWGQLGSHLGFFFDARDTKEWGTRPYPAVHNITREQLGFVNGYGTHIYHDETVAYLIFKLPYFNVMFGKDKNKWGPGFHGNLALSDYATSYDQIKFQVKYWRIKFTSLTGFLRTYPVMIENGQTLSRSLAAHRLELNLSRRFQLGLQETVIYGHRRLEPAYLNPIMFYRSAEHYLAHEDNVTMGLDVDWSAIKNLKLYGELFIDDITTTELGSGYYGNKLGYLAGGYYLNCFSVPNLDLRLEYARIRPYVYTHKLPITTYQHFTTTLGHRIGPNSDDIFIQLKYRFSKALSFTSGFEYQRWGANTDSVNYGRDIAFAHRYFDPEEVDFLEGKRQNLKSISLGIRYELFRNFYLVIKYDWKKLAGQLGNNIQKLPIIRQNAYFSLGINY